MPPRMRISLLAAVDLYTALFVGIQVAEKNQPSSFRSLRLPRDSSGSR